MGTDFLTRFSEIFESVDYLSLLNYGSLDVIWNSDYFGLFILRLFGLLEYWDR